MWICIGWPSREIVFAVGIFVALLRDGHHAACALRPRIQCLATVSWCANAHFLSPPHGTFAPARSTTGNHSRVGMTIAVRPPIRASYSPADSSYHPTIHPLLLATFCARKKRSNSRLVSPTDPCCRFLEELAHSSIELEMLNKQVTERGHLSRTPLPRSQPLPPPRPCVERHGTQSTQRCVHPRLLARRLLALRALASCHRTLSAVEFTAPECGRESAPRHDGQDGQDSNEGRCGVRPRTALGRHR